MHSVADILGLDAGRARRQTGKIETRSDRRAVFRLIEMASGVRSIDLGIESGNQADPLLLEELHGTSGLRLLRASIARALRVHPSSFSHKPELGP